MWRMLWLCLLLSGCVSQGEFSVPQRIVFLGQTFEKITDNRLENMRQLLYLPTKGEKNPDHWSQGFLLFLDRHRQDPEQRTQLRQQIFAAQKDTVAEIRVLNGELHSEIIYPPNERFPNVQLEVSRGKNFPCGFGQMQFADKRPVSAKYFDYTTAYRTDLLALSRALAQLPWLMDCKK